MTKYEYIIEAQQFLVDNWEDAGKKVIETCFRMTPFNNSFDAFLDHCSACGGNWGGMLLTGIKRLYPEVWEAIPNDMGINVWPCLLYTLLLLGVDTTN